jgi:ribonucleotide monophosphatase NagD (HAD superfamily)
MAGFPTTAKGNKIGEIAKFPKPGCPFNKDMVLKQILKYQGNLSRVADSIGSSRGAIRNFVDKHEDLKQVLKDCRERQIDDLEESVFQRAKDSNDTTLQLFVLKTQGKHRGWEQSEAQNAAKDIATAAFDFIINKSKNPAEPSTH